MQLRETFQTLKGCLLDGCCKLIPNGQTKTCSSVVYCAFHCTVHFHHQMQNTNIAFPICSFIFHNEISSSHFFSFLSSPSQCCVLSGDPSIASPFNTSSKLIAFQICFDVTFFCSFFPINLNITKYWVGN